MKKQAFVAKCPLEIGDAVVTVAQGGAYERHEVTDIYAIHSARTGGVTFQYELDWDAVVTVDSILFRLDEQGRSVALTAEQVVSTGPAR